MLKGFPLPVLSGFPHGRKSTLRSWEKPMPAKWPEGSVHDQVYGVGRPDAVSFTAVDFFHGYFQHMGFRQLRNTLFFPFFRLPDWREKAFRFEGWLTGESGAVEWFHAVFLLSESLSIHAPRNP